MAWLKEFSGMKVLEINNGRVKKFSGEIIYVIEDNKVKDFYGKILYFIDGEKIKKFSGEIILYFDGEWLKRFSGTKINQVVDGKIKDFFMYCLRKLYVETLRKSPFVDKIIKENLRIRSRY